MQVQAVPLNPQFKRDFDVKTKSSDVKFKKKDNVRFSKWIIIEQKKSKKIS